MYFTEPATTVLVVLKEIGPSELLLKNTTYTIYTYCNKLGIFSATHFASNV
jgi:hypothetical protein